MAVFTEINLDEANTWLENYSIGKCISLEKIIGGIENSNYFLTTQIGKEHQNTVVLTIFENLLADKIPYHLGLTEHLSNKKILVPKPFHNKNGNLFSILKGKPACIVTKLPGRSVIETNIGHCEALGKALAELHLASEDFHYPQNNVRSLSWWNEMVPKIKAKVSIGKELDQNSLSLLESELLEQNHFFNSQEYSQLPTGHCHCDLFRDNVMFSEDSLNYSNSESDRQNFKKKERITGIFDFYFAGIDKWLFDLAICVNDWCRNTNDNSLDTNRARALCLAYQKVRSLQKVEIELWPMMLRTAAYRFWVSRLSDLLFPRPASALRTHNPKIFQDILQQNQTLNNQAKKLLYF